MACVDKKKLLIQNKFLFNCFALSATVSQVQWVSEFHCPCLRRAAYHFILQKTSPQNNLILFCSSSLPRPFGSHIIFISSLPILFIFVLVQNKLLKHRSH